MTGITPPRLAEQSWELWQQPADHTQAAGAPPHCHTGTPPHWHAAAPHLKGGGDLVGHRLHSGGGQRGAPSGEHLEDKLKEARGLLLEGRQKDALVGAVTLQPAEATAQCPGVAGAVCVAAGKEGRCKRRGALAAAESTAAVLAGVTW